MVGSSASATFGPSLVELTTRRLRDEILSGAVGPGERLIEEQICRRFSISQSPVRESLRLLAQQGLVEHLPRRGARVAVWSDEDVQQLFALRTVLERYAVSSALPLTPANGADPLADVRRHLDRMAAAEKDGDQLAEDDAHRDFHAAIVAARGQPPAGPHVRAGDAEAPAPDGREPAGRGRCARSGRGDPPSPGADHRARDQRPQRRHRRAGEARQPALPQSRPGLGHRLGDELRHRFGP